MDKDPTGPSATPAGSGDVSGLQGFPVNLVQLQQAAGARLEPMAYDYYRSGAHDELTLADNRAAWERIKLHYRVLVDVSERDTSTTVLGQRVALPVLVAPTAFQRLATPEGEVATVRAAGQAGTVMILSTLATTAVETVVAEARSPVWFQLYVYRDREATRALVARAEAAGCTALVLTVDAPLLGCRERDVKNRFRLPEGMAVANMVAAGKGAVGAEDTSGLMAYFASLIDPSLSWEDLEWLASITSLPILIKGVVRPDDAARAADHGAAGIVVSNHGGRQLDTCPATADVLGPIVDAVDGRLEVLVDGGVRRGTDVVKALALGARAVLIGRPILWGLALGGHAGAARVLDMLRSEIDLAMALCGCPGVSDITRDLVGR